MTSLDDEEDWILIDTVSGGLLLLLGDFIIQRIERMRGVYQNAWQSITRSVRVFIIGCGVGLFTHFWYEHILEGLVEGDGLTSVFKKILWDQAIAGPFFSSFFLVGMGLLEFKRFGDIWNEWKMKFLEIYKNDWKVWPLAQFINFTIVPLRFRVLYVHFITLCWDMYLSYAKHSHGKQSCNYLGRAVEAGYNVVVYLSRFWKAGHESHCVFN